MQLDLSGLLNQSIHVLATGLVPLNLLWPLMLSSAIAELSTWYRHYYCTFFTRHLSDVKGQWEGRGKECMKSHTSLLGVLCYA
jgi:hypothetical protein